MRILVCGAVKGMENNNLREIGEFGWVLGYECMLYLVW